MLATCPSHTCITPPTHIHTQEDTHFLWSLHVSHSHTHVPPTQYYPPINTHTHRKLLQTWMTVTIMRCCCSRHLIWGETVPAFNKCLPITNSPVPVSSKFPSLLKLSPCRKGYTFQRAEDSLSDTLRVRSVGYQVFRFGGIPVYDGVAWDRRPHVNFICISCTPNSQPEGHCKQHFWCTWTLAMAHDIGSDIDFSISSQDQCSKPFS